MDGVRETGLPVLPLRVVEVVEGGLSKSPGGGMAEVRVERIGE